MWNRHGEPLSIAGEFDAALDRLHKLSTVYNGCGLIEWWDVEALDRRHELGRGTLIVLDIMEGGTLMERRRRFAWMMRPISFGPPSSFDPIMRLYQFDDWQNPWMALQMANTACGCQFFEGLVAKRTDSPYELQLRSPEEETTNWLKCRWKF
jgi:hypothetical protein